MKIVRWILGRIILILDFITRPKKINRSKENQNRLDEKFKNCSLYEFHTCPFCVKVRRFLRKNSINIKIKDARGNKLHRDDLKKYGGKIQVPCLRIKEDNNADEWLYESKEIIEYFENKI
jgi:glutaredoxin